MPHTYDYPRPSVTVDALIFARTAPGATRLVLLIKRGAEPFKGKYALPGGFVDMEEDLDVAARRELEEETGLSVVKLRQFRAYGAPKRDPRGRSISIAFIGELSGPLPRVKGSDDASEAKFFDVTRLPLPLAFDHEQIIREALQWLSAQPRY